MFTLNGVERVSALRTLALNIGTQSQICTAKRAMDIITLTLLLNSFVVLRFECATLIINGIYTWLTTKRSRRVIRVMSYRLMWIRYTQITIAAKALKRSRILIAMEAPNKLRTDLLSTLGTGNQRRHNVINSLGVKLRKRFVVKQGRSRLILSGKGSLLEIRFFSLAMIESRGP